MGVVQSAHLPPSSAAIMVYLGQQRFEKEPPWKRDQLVVQIRTDPDVLALSCWAIACEQPPGAIPNPAGLQTPEEFVECFRHAVRQDPAAAALEKWYTLMKLPVPDVYLPVQQGDDDFAMQSWDGWMCAGSRHVCGGREKRLRVSSAFTYGDVDDKLPGGEPRARAVTPALPMARPCMNRAPCLCAHPSPRAMVRMPLADLISRGMDS